MQPALSAGPTITSSLFLVRVATRRGAAPSADELHRVGLSIRSWLGRVGACAVLVAGEDEAQLAVALQPQAADERNAMTRWGRELREALARRFDTRDVRVASRPFAPAPVLLEAARTLEPVDLRGLLAVAEEDEGVTGVGAPELLGAERAVWRERALAALPLEWVYGPWLTGRRWESWRECANVFLGPEHLGDTAQVADGSGLAERASVWCPGTDTSLSVFEVLVELGHAATLDEAERLVAELSGVPRLSSPTA